MNQASPRIEVRTRSAFEVLATAAAQCWPNEAGGILLGFREGATIVVNHALIVTGHSASANRYVRDDVQANRMLAEFLANRADDDPTGYVGEWHTHSALSGPSAMDVAAMRAIAKISNGSIALLIHVPNQTEPLVGLVVRRRRLAGVVVQDAQVSLPPPRFEALGRLPAGSVRGDGPVFISYRQSDGSALAESLEHLLRGAGLVVWRDQRDLRPGTTTDRLEQALTQGLSAAVLIVTPEIAFSDVVRERELPRLLQLDAYPAFSLCIANRIARSDSDVLCDYAAPDRLLRLHPARTLADKKQSNVIGASGATEILRDLLMHRVQQIMSEIRSTGRPFTIRIQTRPTPFATDAGNDDLHIRLTAAEDSRLPSRANLDIFQATLPLSSDAVFASDPRIVRVSGGAHLSVALALGAALPETKIGCLEVVDLRGMVWKSVPGEEDPHINRLLVERIPQGEALASARPRVAVFVSLTAEPDLTAFQRLIGDPKNGFTEAAHVMITGGERIDPREAPRLTSEVAAEIRRLAAAYGRGEIHLAFHGPFAMAIHLGSRLNTLRTVVYEWNSASNSVPTYTPVLVLEPGLPGGPISAVLLDA